MMDVSPLAKRVQRTVKLLLAALPCLQFLAKSLAEKQLTLLNVVDLVAELLILAIFYVVVTHLGTPLLCRQAVTALKKKDGGLIGEHKICITADMLTESTSVSESRQKWIGLAGVHQNEHYIIIMIDSQQGHIIPKRAFLNDYVAYQFYTQASEFYQNSQQV